MTPDALIERLAGEITPVRRRRLGTDILIVVATCAAELALFFVLGAARPDMPALMRQPTVWWRLASLGLLCLASGAVAILSFNPVHKPRRNLGWVVAAAAACLLLGLWIWGLPGSLNGAVRRLDWTDGVQCAGKILALSLPPLLCLGALMRRGAATDAAATALLAGLAAASWGAFVFVFACPFDDALYIACWYSVGCGIVTLIARLALPRLTRW